MCDIVSHVKCETLSKDTLMKYIKIQRAGDPQKMQSWKCWICDILKIYIPQKFACIQKSTRTRITPGYVSQFAIGAVQNELKKL